MNLSKIAVGVAVSLCLVSNMALGDSQTESSAQFDNKYSLTLQDKVLAKYEKFYSELDIDNKGSGALNFEEHELPKVVDLYGYGEAYLSLDKIRSHPRRLGAHYIFKTLNDEINENKQKLDTTLEGIDNITTIIGKVSSEKASVKDVQKNKVDIVENKKLITDNTANIDKNKKSIDANKVSIEGNKKSILEMNDKIALNHKSIQDVKSQLNARLNNLNKDLRRGLATQSALTGLFQPYSVGKMNVTAAVGGYQSEKAIAVGSGYRFNDNFAAKVGLSKSLGGSAVSYNMGVNYEF